MPFSHPRAIESGRSSFRRPLFLAWLITVGLCLAVPRTAQADAIDDDMPLLAAKVMKHLKSKDYQNIGVLKFRVKKGNGPPSFNAGPINVAMTNRLENALLIKNDKDKPI